jgi:hypothetical protein
VWGCSTGTAKRPVLWGKGSGFRAQSLSKLLRYIWSGVHKEMSSILAAMAPSNKSPNAGGGGGGGVAESQPMGILVHMEPT